MDAFLNPLHYGASSIESYYVDGLSITHGSPRKHIWTFAVGYSQDYTFSKLNCPCAQYPGPSPPPYVGNDYTCESGASGSNPNPGWYFNQRLWDGKCYDKSNCCTSPNLPYFVKSLGGDFTDDLEVRFCVGETLRDENFGVEQLELFVR